MTAKGRRHRGRYSAPDKKKKGRRRPDTVAPRPAAVSQTATVAASPQNVALPQKVAPQTSETAKKSMVVVTGHLDIMAELRRVGILAVIMLAILVILALVLA